MTVHNGVTSYLGKKAVLPCKIAITETEMKVSQLTWVKEVRGQRQNVVVYNPSHGQNYPMEKNSRRICFLTLCLTDAILAIEHLFLTDEVTYMCKFATYLNGNEVDTNNLVTLAKPIGSTELRK